jgi:hypothetical protein
MEHPKHECSSLDRLSVLVGPIRGTYRTYDGPFRSTRQGANNYPIMPMDKNQYLHTGFRFVFSTKIIAVKYAGLVPEMAPTRTGGWNRPIIIGTSLVFSTDTYTDRQTDRHTRKYAGLAPEMAPTRTGGWNRPIIIGTSLVLFHRHTHRQTNRQTHA